MKVKFYKGPWHGKSKEVSAETIERGVIQVHTLPKGNLFTDTNYGPKVATFEIATYRMRRMRLTLPSGQSWQAPAMHPDGSIFFVYEGTH